MKNLNLLATALRNNAARSAAGLPAPFAESYISDGQLISELVSAMRLRGANPKTIQRAEHCLGHYRDYLRDVHGCTILTAETHHVLGFMDHLAQRGGERPHPSRQNCPYCRERGYPSPYREGGWAPSTRKAYFSYLRLVYGYSIINATLPSRDPTAGLSAPKVAVELGPTLTREELRALLTAPGTPDALVISVWLGLVPSRLGTLPAARWRDIDLVAGTWRVVGKGNSPDVFRLHPLVVATLRDHQERQRVRAETNPKLRAALARPDTAFVLMTRNGRPMCPSQIRRTLKRQAVRAGVGVIDATSRHDAVDGKTSWVSPHVLRRTWADLNLNDPDNPVEADVVRQVLNHISPATLRHYAQPKPQRAQDALRNFEI